MEQKNITFSKGLTTVPSDMLCSDNELEICDGVVYQEGEMRPVPSPVVHTKACMGKALFKHHTSTGQDNIIYQYSDGSLYWLCVEQGTGGQMSSTAYGDVQLQAIGNVVIVNQSEGLHYYIWKAGGYIYKEKLPIPIMHFRCVANNILPSQFTTRELYEGILELEGSKVKILKKEDADNLFTGLYSSAKKKTERSKKFHAPFFIRYALRMYDGSYTLISNPILIYAAVRRNLRCQIYKQGGYVLLRVEGVDVEYRIANASEIDFSLWKDLILGITVFATPQVSLYDADVLNTTEVNDFFSVSNDTSAAAYEYVESNSTKTNTCIYDTVRAEYTADMTNYHFGEYFQRTTSSEYVLSPFKGKSDDEIITELENSASFFKLCDIPLSNVELFVSLNGLFDSHTIENLETQEQLAYDDYYSHCEMSASIMKTYNSRLILANIKRTLFSGFTHFSTRDLILSSTGETDTKTFVYKVTLNTKEGEKTVIQTTTTTEWPGGFFYYPDIRATKVEIYDKGAETLVTRLFLKVHPLLNGAYYINNLPVGFDGSRSGYYSSGTSATVPTSSSNYTETLENQIVASEVNNPWIFLAKGYNTVQNSTIMGIATLTTAISQGQFGSYPIIIFTDKGIYSMGVTDEGYLGNTTPPFSRETCNNASSITEVDGAVFFSTAKGLMCVVGGEVNYASSQLRGKAKTYTTTDDGSMATIDTDELFANCEIAYDYRGRRLIIYVPGTSYALIYSITSGAFSFVKSDFVIARCVNAFPDYYLQGSDNTLYSLINRPNDDDDIKLYSGTMQTRPLKLGNALNLKKICQVKNLSNMSSEKYELSLMGSNDLQNWTTLTSIRGAGKKFYKFAYKFSNMTALDRFTTTVMLIENEIDNRLH